MLDKMKLFLKNSLKNNIINDYQYVVLYDFYLNSDESVIINDLSKMLDNDNFLIEKYNMILSDEVPIIDIDDGLMSGKTGVIPIGDLSDIVGNSFDESNENSMSLGGVQKTLGTGGLPKMYDDSGFLSLVSLIFLTGISVGIILMIILNFIA